MRHARSAASDFCRKPKGSFPACQYENRSPQEGLRMLIRQAGADMHFASPIWEYV